MSDERARQLVKELLIAGADRGFRSLDTFVSWFVGGTAAGVALLIANIDKISPYVAPSTLGYALHRVILAFCCVVVAKYLGS